MGHRRLMDLAPTFTAFRGQTLVAHGDLVTVASAVAGLPQGAAIILDDATGHAVDLDLRGGPEAAVAEHRARAGAPLQPTPRPGRGRPRLGVVAREVTLLPRHWDWLARQPGGASAALRRLVEDARRESAGADGARATQEALYRAMSTLAGNAPGFEEASRALFAGDSARLDAIISSWPADVATYIRRLAAAGHPAG